MKGSAWLFVLVLLLLPVQPVGMARPAAATASLRYLSPPDGAQFVPAASTVALRLDGPIDSRSLTLAAFTVIGASSGPHPGRVRLADDGATVVFEPAARFAAGEVVTVTVGPGWQTRSGAVFGGLSAHFSVVRQTGDPRAVAAALAAEETPASANPAMPSTPARVSRRPQDDVTFPDDFPAYTVTVPASQTAPGLLFLSPFPYQVSGPSELLITADTGEPVYWRQISAGFRGHDFKVQPDGHLTYYDETDARFHVLDNTYTEVKTISAANGYTADVHDLQILPNGHALFLIYDPVITDTTHIISPGGYVSATVIGLVIQELDTSTPPVAVFQWRSWDHFLITDTYQALNTQIIDYVHGNSIGVDPIDHQLLLSSRHLSEVTKIDHNAVSGLGDGHFIWRLGGKHNQFTFANDIGNPFACQHDVRRLANGDLTLFDNHNTVSCPIGGGPSRAVEYQLNEPAKIITNTWEYHNSPQEFGFAMGDAQRLPDGHTLIGWGFGHPNVTEVLTDGTKIFELLFDPHYQSYRALRFPWTAVPAWAPTLVLTGTLTPTLYYSWNGATEVASYEIYGGLDQNPNVLLTNQPRTGFEDHTALASLPAGYCAYRIRPIDQGSQPQRFSNTVYTQAGCRTRYLPFVIR